jgi:hypothetical protein
MPAKGKSVNSEKKSTIDPKRAIVGAIYWTEMTTAQKKQSHRDSDTYENDNGYFRRVLRVNGWYTQVVMNHGFRSMISDTLTGKPNYYAEREADKEDLDLSEWLEHVLFSEDEDWSSIIGTN